MSEEPDEYGYYYDDDGTAYYYGDDGTKYYEAEDGTVYYDGEDGKTYYYDENGEYYFILPGRKYYKECTTCDCPDDPNYDEGSEGCICKGNQQYDYDRYGDYCKCIYNFSDPDRLPYESTECECAFNPHKSGCPNVEIANYRDGHTRAVNSAACLVGVDGWGAGERCECPEEQSELECKGGQAMDVFVGALGVIDAPTEIVTLGLTMAVGDEKTFEGPESLIACNEDGTCSSDDISALAVDSYALEGNIVSPEMSKVMDAGSMVAMMMMPPAGLVGTVLMVADMFVNAVDPYGYNSILLKETFDNLYSQVDTALTETVANLYGKCMESAGAGEVKYMSKTHAAWWCNTPEAEGGGKEKCDMNALLECINYIPVNENAEAIATYEFYPKPPMPFCNPETDQNCERNEVFNAALRKYANENAERFIDLGMDPSFTTEYKNADMAGFNASESLSDDDPLNKNKMGMIIPAIVGLMILQG